MKKFTFDTKRNQNKAKKLCQVHDEMLHVWMKNERTNNNNNPPTRRKSAHKKHTEIPRNT